MPSECRLLGEKMESVRFAVWSPFQTMLITCGIQNQSGKPLLTTCESYIRNLAEEIDDSPKL